ncbi:MAG: carbon storage regulator [Acidobacteriota bacterium]
MLVIRRKSGESFFIGDDIEVEILDASGSQVKLGIRAPKEIPVVRKEIRLVSDQNRVAARPIPGPRLEQFIKSLKSPSADPIRPL